VSSPHSAIFAAVNAVPGCTADKVSIRGGTSFEARVMCLGPSLHRTGTMWKGEVETLEDDLSPFVAIQTLRRARAEALGLDPDKPDAARLDHILVDRLLRDFSPGAVIGDVDRVVARANQLSMPGAQEAVLVSGVILMDPQDDDPRPRALVDRSMQACSYDGRTVMLSTLQTLPGAAVIAAVGHRVRDVFDVDLGEHMAPVLDRTITHLTVHDWSDAKTYGIYTRPDWVPMIT
jgi:hypothetical protein